MCIRSSWTYDRVIFDAIGLSPRTHDKRIVERNASHDINALRLQGGQVLDEAWEMLGGAAGREGTGDGEENDFLAGEFCDHASVSGELRLRESVCRDREGEGEG